MAMDPANLEGVGEQLAQLYSDAELQLITRIAKSLEKGLAAPDWAVRQLAAANTLGIEARGLLYKLAPEVASAIQSAIAEATLIGVQSADEDIADIPGPAKVAPAAAIDTAAATALAAETITAVTDTHRGVLRAVEDNYRRIVAEVAGRTVTGVATRREVTQQALNKFADAGIGVFTDRSGRNWKIDSYAEMAIRTATLRAMNTGHTNRLKQRGYDLVVISSHPAPAPVCKPYEGKILSLSGSTPIGRRQFNSARTGEPVTETVYGTLDAAQRNGLHHPNCRHRHTLFVPGVDRPNVSHEDGDQAYEDGQELRRLERDVRKWKRREAVALTPAEKARAAAKIRDKQAKIRDHVDATGVRRLRHREQLRTGNAGLANDSTNIRRIDADVEAASKLTAERKAADAAKRAAAAERKRNTTLTEPTRNLVEDARARMPKDRAGWLDTTLKYPKDINGAKLVPVKLAGHLDTTLTVGKAVRADAFRRIDKDPAVRKLRAEDKELLASGGAFSPRRNEIERNIARRERAIILDAIREVRPLGGIQQAATISDLNVSDATVGNAAGLASVRRAETIFPTDWLRAANERGELNVGKADRAFYNETWDFIAAPETDHLPNYRGAFDSYTDEVMAHELGHRMEATIPGLTQLEFALVRSRSTKNGVLESPTPVYPGKPELASELGYEDDWRDRYAGKTYSTDTMADPARRAAEAFQVGIQDTFGRRLKTGEFDTTTQLQEFVIGVMTLL